MIPLSTTLLHGLLICLPFSLFVLISFWWNPRLWLHSLPADIAQLAPPKTEGEERVTNYVLLPVYLLILPGLSFLSTVYVATGTATDLSFFGALLHLYGIWLIVHLWDFLILDGITTFLIDARHPPIPGTEGARGWKDYGFHFRSFLKASVMSSLFVVPGATVVSWLV